MFSSIDCVSKFFFYYFGALEMESNAFHIAGKKSHDGEWMGAA